MRPTAFLAVLVVVLAAPIVPADSSENPKLSSTQSVSLFRVSPDGTAVVYKGNDGGAFRELWSAPIDGSAAPVKLNGSIVSGGTVESFWITRDDQRVIYLADQETPGVHELHSAPIDGSGPAVKLSGSLSHCSATGTACQTANECPGAGNCIGSGGVCESDLDCPGMLNVCIDIAAQSCDLTGDVQILPLVSTRDGTRVVYVADQEADEQFDIFSVEADGSAAPIKLNDPWLHAPPDSPFSWSITVTISPDSTRVFYVVDPEGDVHREIFSVPIDRSSPPIKLSGPMVPGGSVVSAIRVTQDGTRVVYRADQEVDGIFNIYSVPADGSAAATKLSDNVGTNSFNLSHDDEHVVYNTGRLFSVPIDGSAPPIQLSPPMANLFVTYMSVSREKPYAAFAFQDDTVLNAIYSVPVDGSSEALELVPLSANVDVRFLTFQSTRVVYSAYDSLPELTLPLFSVPSDGSRPPTMLNDPLGEGDLVSVPAEGGDRTGPVRLFRQWIDGSYDLFSVPVTGSLPPAKLNGPLASGSVEQYRLNAGATWAVYIAAQDTAGMEELYSRHLDTDADGVPDDADNCPMIPNSGQGPVSFGQTLLASNRAEFSWEVTADEILYVRGPLGGVDSYAIDALSAMRDLVAFVDPTEPAPGEGMYYLVRPGDDCAVATWQTEAGGEPSRDVTLP